MIHHDAELLLAAGAVLDDLAPDEQAAYEVHRAGCAACAVAEDELALVLADLVLVVPERLPPPDLLAGIRRAIDAEDEVDEGRIAGAAGNPSPPLRLLPKAASPGAAGPPVVARPPRPVAGALALVAVLAIVAVGIGARSAGLQAELDRSEAVVERLRAELDGRGAVLAAAVDPAHVSVVLHPKAVAPDAQATVMYVPGTETAWVVAERLPTTGPGQGYQLWYADEAGVHGLQTVVYDGIGPFVAPLGVDLATSDAVMLTLEDAGGAQGEPGPQVVFGEL